MLLFSPNAFVFRILSKNLKIKIYNNIASVLDGSEAWSLILREERRL